MITQNIFDKLLDFSEEVEDARQSQSPLVALESTIISHGLPAPDNYDLAKAAEATIRNNGAIPATIGLINGRIKVGLKESEISYLAESKSALKISAADIPTCIAQKKSGGTTVSATLLAATLTNIKVFVTGGIGGVHRNYEQTMDISSDLKQLSMSPISLICAGPKAILDIRRTIEHLETLGVPIITYQSKIIPAFWSRNSGIESPIVAKTASQIAKSHILQEKIGTLGGQLICNPVSFNDEISNEEIEPIIENAIRYAQNNSISGKDLTPFLLKEVALRTDGSSIICNKSLLLNNAILGASVAKGINKNLQKK